MYETVHISISIARTPQDVYEFASSPANLSLWAAGLTNNEIIREGDCWMAEAPFGRVRIRFAEKNSLGVMDHEVELESGRTVYNPMRVVPNGEGSEFTFTLIRQPDMNDQQFSEDRIAVEKDLLTLKNLLENQLDASS